MLKLTDAAITEIKSVMATQNLPLEENFLLIRVAGSPCSGLNFSLGFGNESNLDPLNDDRVVVDGLTYVIDRRMAPILNDVTVEYVSNDQQRGFRFDRPMVQNSCCGGGCK